MENSPIAIDGWMNLTALSAVIGTFVWGITKGLPSLVNSFREESQTIRNDLVGEITRQRNDFREEIKLERAAFQTISISRDEALKDMARSCDSMRQEFHELRKPGG